MSALPAVTRDKDQSLSAALSGMVESHETSLRLGDHDPHVATVRRLPAEPARFAPFPDGTDARLREALAKRGIEQLYTHQAAAIAHALARRNTVIITPTASGKTRCYNAPVLQSILTDPSSRALYLFPTKALAQDQLAELHQLVELIDQESTDPDPKSPSLPVSKSPNAIGVFTYDGDTPQDARR